MTLVKPDILAEDTHEVVIPYKKSEIGAPRPSKANDGRFNRKGTSYLYLASSLETAINEVRPSIGHKISVGKFKINKEVKLIDFTKLNFYDYAFSDKKIEEYVKLSNLAKIMSIPNPDKEYAITQCFADALVLLGYDGIKFHSSVVNSTEEDSTVKDSSEKHKPYNVVLFFWGNANYVDGSHQVVHIKGLKYEYKDENIHIDEDFIEEYIDKDNPQNEDVARIIEENFDIKMPNYALGYDSAKLNDLLKENNNIGVKVD